jgi:hypothetical protein
MTAEVIAVAVLPGEMALTRIPSPASSEATDLVIPMTACLQAV